MRVTHVVLLFGVAGSLACGQTTSNPAVESGGAPTTGDSAGEAGAAPRSDSGAPAVEIEGGRASGGAPTDGGAFASDGGALTNVAGDTAQSEAGATSEHCAAPGARFATSVVEHSFGGGQSFNQDEFPDPILGPPEANQPSTVVSLGNGGYVVLAFDGNAIVDGPGADFTVFENPLPAYKELATVAVSDDGVTWLEFPCTAPEDGPDYGDCAGVALVYSSTSNGISPLDPDVSGGDHYDLAELGLQRARYVRVTDRADLVGGVGDVFDLDAVAIVHAECP